MNGMWFFLWSWQLSYSESVSERVYARVCHILSIYGRAAPAWAVTRRVRWYCHQTTLYCCNAPCHYGTSWVNALLVIMNMSFVFTWVEISVSQYAMECCEWIATLRKIHAQKQSEAVCSLAQLSTQNIIIRGSHDAISAMWAGDIEARYDSFSFYDGTTAASAGAS